MCEDNEYKRMYEHILKDYKQVDRALELACGFIVFIYDEMDNLSKKEKKKEIQKQVDYYLSKAKDEIKSE